MGKSIRIAFVALASFIGIGVAEGVAFCSSCKTVDCSFEYQCGHRCDCVKLNGNIKGQCVQRY